MARVKGGKHSAKRRRNVLRAVKGYRFARSKKERAAKEALRHAGKYAFAHRKDKKNDFRRLWTVRINGALDQEGSSLSYSKLIHTLNTKQIHLNRKMLAHLAEEHPQSFKRLLQSLS